jgi:glycosyltransferase involved in cell wall biosynthesis
VLAGEGLVADVVGDGMNGFLFEPGATDQAAERLATLALDSGLRARLGEAGRAYVRDRYAVERLVDDVDRLYRSLLVAKGIRRDP